jgi:predicted ArsR family transcriptional regulator
MTERVVPAGVAQLELLAEPTRRAVFEAVRTARGPLTRDEVAAQISIQRGLAAFHLDRLAEAGLLHVSYARPPDRSGRGAGRPAKRYDARGVSLSVSVPTRQHDVVGRLLARAVAEDPHHADHRAAELAQAEGHRLGEQRRPGRKLSASATLDVASDALSELGYEPELVDRGLRLRNCPFHGVVEAAPDLVCGMNARLISGLLDGLGGSPQVCAELDPTPGECCVTVSKQRRTGRDSTEPPELGQ